MSYDGNCQNISNTVNRKMFVVKIFSDSMGSAKIKRMNIMHIINANVLRGRLSGNYLHEN